MENAVFLQLFHSQSAEKIRFWRTIQKQEVDFVVDGATAYEVKINSFRQRVAPSSTYGGDGIIESRG